MSNFIGKFSKIIDSNISKNKAPKAFSLLELSIVLVIAAILITAALSFSSTSSDVQKVVITNKKMEAIYKALGNFIAKNGRLPCPAGLTLIKLSSANYGVEVGSPGNCTSQNITTHGEVYESDFSPNLYYGMIPTATLGLSKDFAEDGFDSKIGYVVNENLTVAGVNGFGSASVGGDQIVVDAILSSGTNSLTSQGAFIFISFGKNKSGAFPTYSASQNSDSSDANELSNSISGTTSSFDRLFVFSSQISDSFDDIVFFKSRDQIATDFNLLDKIFCSSADAVSSNTTINPYGILKYPASTGTTMNFPDAKYQEVVSSTINCPSSPTNYQKGPNLRPTRRCDAFGRWGSVINPCLQ